MRERIFSRKFLGITLVPYSTRPRRVGMTVFAHGYYASVCGKDKVVISSDDCFKHSFERHDYTQRQIANVLLALEVITKEVHEEFVKLKRQQRTDEARNKMKIKADELEDLMKDFGINLSKDQREKVNNFLKIEAL